MFFSHCLTFFFFLSLSLFLFLGEMHLARTHSCLHFTCVLCLCTLSCVSGFQRLIEQLKILEAKKSRKKKNCGGYYAKKKKKRDDDALVRDVLTNAVKKGTRKPQKKKKKTKSIVDENTEQKIARRTTEKKKKTERALLLFFFFPSKTKIYTEKDNRRSTTNRTSLRYCTNYTKRSSLLALRAALLFSLRLYSFLLF